MCSLNDNKPIRSNTHELAALLAQHVRRRKILAMTSNFWAKRDFSPYTYIGQNLIFKKLSVEFETHTIFMGLSYFSS